MSKLAVLGHNRDDLVKCSEVIPQVQEVKNKPFLPVGKTMDNMEGSYLDTPFPTLTADPGISLPLVSESQEALIELTGPETAVHAEKKPAGQSETKAAF